MSFKLEKLRKTFKMVQFYNRFKLPFNNYKSSHLVMLCDARNSSTFNTGSQKNPIDSQAILTRLIAQANKTEQPGINFMKRCRLKFLCKVQKVNLFHE